MTALPGVCDLCGQELLLTDDDCWHPYTVLEACPPEPPSADVAAWQELHRAGHRTGRPGRQHWRAP